MTMEICQVWTSAKTGRVGCHANVQALWQLVG